MISLYEKIKGIYVPLEEEDEAIRRSGETFCLNATKNESIINDSLARSTHP